MSGKPRRKPAQVPAPAPAAERTTDYTRAGGRVLTDMGWIPEERVDANGATRSTVTE